MTKLRAFIIAVVVALLPTTAHATATASTSQNDPYRVVALGDSFSSGNGALDYYDKDCYRSENAYIDQFAELISSERSVSAKNYACHSNTTEDILSQIANASEELSRADAVFITIGGNDGDFTSIVIQCVSPIRFVTLCHDDINKARDNLDEIMANVRTSLLDIHRAAPQADVVLIGYPYLVARNCNADSDIIRSLQAAADSHAYAMVLELRRTHGDWVHYLQTTTAFAGGEVCGDDAQLIRGALDTFNKNEWYHPNVEGHRKIAQLLAGLDLHVEATDTGSISWPSIPDVPTYQPSTPDQSYVDLPFECGVSTPFASTYRQFTIDYRTYFHGHALDFPMPEGTPIISPESGTVSVSLNAGGYGKLVTLHGDSGVEHRFAHLQHTAVNPGQRVSRGQELGLVGSTGASTGPHLHYEQRRNGEMVPIDLGGPALQWGNEQDSSGFKTTTHALVSGNCATPSSFADVITVADEGLVWHRGNGVSRDGWRILKDDMPTPTSVDSCDMDGDGYDEYLVLHAPSNRVFMMDSGPVQNGTFTWRHVASTKKAAIIVCGDFNGDGLDDLLVHNTQGGIYVNPSKDGGFPQWYKVHQHSGSAPKYWDACDLNGDGHVDFVSYHADTKQIIVGQYDNGLMTRQEIFGYAPGTRGIACGNFLADSADELVMWDWGRGGRYMILEYDANFRKLRSQGLQPTGFLPPHNGEMGAADVDGDGLDEFMVNEYRPDTDNFAIMVGDFTSNSEFAWHPFHHRTTAGFTAFGEFVK